MAQSRNYSFGINTMTELTNITTVSDNNGIWQGMFQTILSDVIVIFFSSTVRVVLTPKGQFLDCATTAFSERYLIRFIQFTISVLVFC